MNLFISMFTVTQNIYVFVCTYTLLLMYLCLPHLPHNQRLTLFVCQFVLNSCFFACSSSFVYLSKRLLLIWPFTFFEKSDRDITFTAKILVKLSQIGWSYISSFVKGQSVFVFKKYSFHIIMVLCQLRLIQMGPSTLVNGSKSKFKVGSKGNVSRRDLKFNGWNGTHKDTITLLCAL